MMDWLNQVVDKASDYFAHRKGLLPLISMALILLNLLFQFLPLGWLSESNLFLHFGLLLAIFSMMLAWAL